MRSASLVVGLFGVSTGLVLFLLADLGLSPWDVLHQGISEHTPISFGMANVAVGVVCTVLAWRLGERPGVGTLANALLVGTFIELLLGIDAIPSAAGGPLALRIAYIVCGVLAFGMGSAFYLGAGMGAGPRDSLMLLTARRLHTRVGVARTITEASALGLGVALGGSIGAGTLVFALGAGPSIELWFFILGRSTLARPALAPA
jgi:uncharacterized membrane protein YczE